MLFLKKIDALEATSNLKLQKSGNFEYAYLSKYLTYIIMPHTKKAYNQPSKTNLYLKILFLVFH